MSDTYDISGFCDLKVYDVTFGLDPSVIDLCPSLNIALRTISLILSNEHLLTNFASHFIPYDEYTGKFPVSFGKRYRRIFFCCFFRILFHHQ